MATVVGASTGAIDVQSTVDQLVEVEMVRRIDPIDRKVAARRVSLSAVAELKTLSAGLEDSLDSLADAAQFSGTDSERLSKLTESVKGFVASYNALQAGIVKYGTIDLADPNRDTVSEVPLFGDPTLIKLRQMMRQGYSAGLTYANTLSDRTDATTTVGFTELGVSRKADGTLAFSKSKLATSSALDTTVLSRPTDGDLLADSAYAQPKLLDRFSTGVSSSLKTSLASASFGIVGIFDLRTSQLNNQLYTLNNKRVSESAKIEAERARFLRTYSTLNSLLANMSSTSNFLTAQLASLTKNN
jgi:flagellar hook-associated protein 2